MKEVRVLLIGLVILMGCQTHTSTPQGNQSQPTAETPIIREPSLPSPGQTQSPIATHLLISDQGIGLARLGITFQQLKQKLGTSAQFKVISNFIVDFDAIAVYQSGNLQYYIVYPSGKAFVDSDVIELLSSDNPNYRTAEGVGAGTTLQQAQNIYGQAILSYNTQNESREMVRFANYLSRNIIFRPKVASADFAGIYQSSSAAAEYHETKVFNDTAVISSIFVGR
jgi:hypothetical protein